MTGQKVKAGEVLADGASTEMGQLALGANVNRSVHAMVRTQL